MKEINETWFELREDGLDYDTLKSFIYEQKELLLESANLNMLNCLIVKLAKVKRIILLVLKLLIVISNKDSIV